MTTKLERVSKLSSENPNMVFTAIGHLIDAELLKECHSDMDGKKAVGIDGVTKDMYGEHLEENLKDLINRLKNKSYRPKPARKVEIPKDNGKMRTLSIYCYEDKLVQEALKQVLMAVFEPHFYNEMMGFRPNRNCHSALRLLNTYIEKNKTSYVLDADIKGFFDHLDHEWIIKFVESKIKDPNIIRLVRRMIKAGTVEDYQIAEVEEGAGQGSVCSPVLANIYMHYVLVWWFKERIQPRLRGFSGLVVYADDFVVCFQYKEEAERFYEALKARMATFGLQLEEEKTRLIEFGRFAAENRRKRGLGKPETFTFLGFTHYCSKNRNGRFFRVKRKTSKKKLRKKMKALNIEIRNRRSAPVANTIVYLNKVLLGYYCFYGITDNLRSLQIFYDRVKQTLFYWLNRRSQKKSYTWEGFNDLLKVLPLNKPKTYVSIYHG